MSVTLDHDNSNNSNSYDDSFKKTLTLAVNEGKTP